MMIKIHKYNESFIFVECGYSDAKKISEQFEFYAPNFQFSPKYKNGWWDGKIRLFNVKDCLLPQGLLFRLIKFLKSSNYEFEIIDNELITNGKKINSDSLIKFSKKILHTNLVPRDYQINAVQHMLYRKKMVALSATSCHGKGQQILMFDGSFKGVENIKVGDKLMGPDGHPRNVLKLFTGRDEIFKVIPNKSKPFTVTKNHILSLKLTSKSKRYKHLNDIQNITVDDYLKSSKNFKHLYKLYKTDTIDSWVDKNIPIPSYILGLLLGDGCLKYGSVSIASMDKEIIEEIYSYAKKERCKIVAGKKKGVPVTYYFRNNKGQQNSIMEKIRFLELNDCGSENKFIPEQYKYSSINTRLELLAGLMDTDGCLSKKRYFDYVTKSKKLGNDIIFLCHSLGLASNIYKINKKCQNGFVGEYYRIHISGDTYKIPCRLPRKQAIKYDLRTNPKHEGFKIQYHDYDEFYGFALDRDHLYLLDDFTVTHNSGKSFIAFLFFNLLKYLDDSFKFLLVVPTTALVEQMHGDFCEYGRNFADYGDYIHRVYAGKQKYTDKPITVSTWQSLQRVDKRYFEQFDAVIVDECHTASAKQLTNIVNRCTNARFKIGMSGTLNDTKVDKLQLEGLFGPIRKVSRTKDLMRQGYVSKLRINGIVLRYPKPDCRLVRNAADWGQETKFINEQTAKHRYVCALANSRKNNTLVLFRLRRLGKTIQGMLERGSGKKVFYVDGTVGVKYREEVRRYCEANDDAVVVASYGTFSTGINIKNLHNIVFAESMKSLIKVLQSVGRLLRLHESKDFATLFDIADDLTYGRKKNYVLKHFLKRIGYYENEGFTYNIKNVNLER